MVNLELIPKAELPEWGEEDENLKRDFDKRMRTGNLHLISAKNLTK